MVVVDKNGKDSILEYNVVSNKKNLSMVDIHLVTGRSHQIRVQFSSRGYPLYGDQRYNKDAIVGEQIALFSYYLSFIHPVTKEKMEFKENIPSRKPWNMFLDT